MTTLNDSQLANIIGGISAAAFIQDYADQDGSLFISGVRTTTGADGTIFTSKRHKIIENANADSLASTLNSFRNQGMTSVIVGSGANYKEYSMDKLSAMLA